MPFCPPSRPPPWAWPPARSSAVSAARRLRTSGPPLPRPPIAVETPKLCSRLLAHIEGLSTGTHPAERPSLVFLQHYSFFRSFSQEESRTDQKQANFSFPFVIVNCPGPGYDTGRFPGTAPVPAFFLVSLSSNHVPCRAETAGGIPISSQGGLSHEERHALRHPPLHLDPRVLLDGLLHPALLLQRLSSGTGPFQHRDRPAAGAVRPGLRPIAAGGRGPGRADAPPLPGPVVRLPGGRDGAVRPGPPAAVRQVGARGAVYGPTGLAADAGPLPLRHWHGLCRPEHPFELRVGPGGGQGPMPWPPPCAAGSPPCGGWGPSLWCCWRPPSCCWWPP